MKKKLTLRLDDNDYKLLEDKRELLGCSQNKFFIELLKSVNVENLKEYNQYIKDIFRILKITSNNLNQIAKKVNNSDNLNNIEKELEEIWQFLKQ